MRLAGLSTESIAAIRSYPWDRIIEKHEGPERWSDTLDYCSPEFLSIAGHDVLLPIDQEHHANVTILRCIEGDDGHILLIFLRDTTFGTEWFEAGYLAVCEQLPGEEFYLASVYHEWFVMDPRTGPVST